MNHMRQVNLFDPADFERIRVGIIGLGNIGSHTALTLARMGINNFDLYDDDIIEDHNLSSQSYSLAHLDVLKVNAVAGQIIDFNKEAKITVHPTKFTLPDGEQPDIYICGVDSLEARKEICKQLAPLDKLEVRPVIIDGRIGGEQLEVYTCNSAEEWEKTIPEEASEEPCGGRYIAYVSVMIGGVITAQVKKVLQKQDYPKTFLMNMGNYDQMKDYEW